MAAYAGLVSLLNNMEQIRNHPRLSNSFEKKQMESLHQRVDFLLDFIETYNSYGVSKEEAEEIEKQIASAAHAAEDVIESHVVDQILGESTEEWSSFIKKVLMKVLKMQLWKSGLERVMLDLQRILQDMDSVREKIIRVKEERGYEAELPESAASSTPPTAGKGSMVGFDGYLIQLLDQLTGHQPDRQIIPVVGMGGIGKTTLAKNAYDSLLVVQHFDVRAWVTVSEGYNVREILLETLSCLGQSIDGLDKKSEHELGEKIYKALSGMRYLIILDDVWSIQVWDEINFFFPNKCNRSRIIVTTRILDVANRSSSTGLALDFLDDDHSWKLFCENVFSEEPCPPELEEIGMKIVKKCKGLPLSIVVIGGVLRNSSRTLFQWENVEKDTRSILSTAEDNRCLNLLSLSYRHLPARLKPCFLYLGIFPEDDVINVSRLVKLWVAEGFIKPNKDRSLEETAESYTKDLVDRNLISVNSLRGNGKVKTVCIHDLLRDLCIKVAEKEKFLCITSELGTQREMRRIVIHGSTGKGYYNTQVLDTLKSKSVARSLIFNQGRRVHVKSRLLRVLVGVYSEPRDIIFQQVNLRFLAEEYNIWSIMDLPNAYRLPSSISLLWNLQTLIITGSIVSRVYAPSEIWKMPQLRHIIINFVRLPEPPPASDGIVLHNLQTLVRVSNFRFSEEACKRMPNIKKLHAYFAYFSRDSANFASFNKLESLLYQFDHEPKRDNLLQPLQFPNSLKKLTLKRLPLQWKNLTVIGSLPHLEVLILKNSTRGSNWDPVEGEFLRLRFLRIVESDLVSWNADNTHFPVLESLTLDALNFLNEIPSGVGDIHTLKRISLANCSDSSALSALKILEEQQSLGNEGLQVKLRFSSKWNVKKFVEQVEEEGLTGLNFQIDVDAHL